jgi:hypothetical protein
MKSNSGNFTRRALLAGLVAGSGILAASAYAVTTERSGDRPRCEARALQKGEAGREGRRAAHLAALKEKLKLASGQEAAWDAFAAALQSGPRHPGMDHGAMRAELEKLTTPQRLDRLQAMAEMRRARMAERAEAIKTFYAQLSPEQQGVFDAEAFSGRGHRGHHFHHHRS